jgi:O-antigen ligase
MSYRNLETVDYEPVTRRGKADARSDENEFDSLPPFEFPSPRFADDTENSQPQKSRRKQNSNPSAAIAPVSSESWILKRGHTLSYLGIFLFTFVLYFRPYELIPALSALSSMAMILALMTVGIFVPSQLALEGNLTARPREVNLLLLLTVTALLSIPTAISPGEAWAEFNDTYVKAVMIFIVMVNVMRNEWRLMGLIWLALGVGCLLSLNALDNYRAGNFTVEGYRVEGNLGGMFGNPNDMALHLVTMVPIAVVLLLKTRNALSKLLYGACAALMVAGTVVTFSRGGFLGLLAGAFVLTWKLGRKRRLAVTVVSLIVLVLFLILAPGNYGSRLLTLFDSNLDAVGSSSARRELLKRSIIVALRHPIFGIGMGNFHIVSIQEHVSHNAYTQVAAEMGMAAAALYTMFIVTPLKRLRQIERATLHNLRGSNFHYMAVGIQASLVAYMVGSFFASVAYQWYVYYLVAYAISLRRIYDAEQHQNGDGDHSLAMDEPEGSGRNVERRIAFESTAEPGT